MKKVAILVNSWNKIKLLPDAVGLSSHSIKSLSPPSDERFYFILFINFFISRILFSCSFIFPLLYPFSFNFFFFFLYSPRIGVIEGGYYLITQGQGELIVSLSVLVPYSSARRSGMSLWVPRY